MPATEETQVAIRQDAERVWNEALAVTEDDEVARWLTHERKLDPELLVSHNLARVAAPATELPKWAGFERNGRWHSWPSSGYRIIVPLVDAWGRISSMRFRKPSAGAKGRSASGISGIGLVMADKIAQAVLVSRAAPEFCIGSPFTILIAEGEPDFWSWSTEPARRGLGYAATTFPAVLGIVSGSFNVSVASRLPDGTHIISAMDRDRGGDQIHARLAQVLAQADRGFTLARWSPT